MVLITGKLALAVFKMLVNPFSEYFTTVKRKKNYWKFFC